MSRLIDADDLKDLTVRINSIWDGITDSSGRGLSKIINSIPSVEVVRCKDCRAFDKERGLCNRYFGIGHNIEADDYCSYGERKTE